MLLTVDSSAFVAAVQPREPHHMACDHLLGLLGDGIHEVVIPITVLVEVAAAIRRRTGSEVGARRMERNLRSLPGIQLPYLNSARAQTAIRIASTLGLRGMDAIVVQVAQEFGATLVTLDAEMAQRAAGVVGVRDVARF